VGDPSLARPHPGTAVRTLSLCAASIAVMVPWPLLGIVLMHSSFDKQSEAFLFFGGVTMFPLMLLSLFGSVPESTYIAVFMLVWLAVAVVPIVLIRRRFTVGWIVGVLCVQMGFSLAQAAMGAMLIIGKSV
jgi:general stress protein CsbA